VNLVSGDAPHTSFGGVLRYPIGAVVTPIVDVNESCGMHQELTLNGEPYVHGTPVLDEGLYILTVSAADNAGNHAANTSYFEIRERPSHTAVAVVRDTFCEIDPGGESGFISTTVLVASDLFDHEAILRSSPVLVLQDSDGSFMAHQPAVVSDALINDCWLELTFDAELTSPDGVVCPSFVNVLGVGLANDQIAFEWGATAPNVADASPDSTLLALINGPGSCEALREPDPEPVVPCQAIETFHVTSQKCADFKPDMTPSCLPGSYDRFYSEASTFVQGQATTVAIANGNQLCVPATPACPPQIGSGLLAITFSGDCCACSVLYTGSAAVKAWAEIDGDIGYALADGHITFSAFCGSITVTATAEAGSLLNPPVLFDQDGGLDQQQQLSCTVAGCTSSAMVIGTSAEVVTTSSASNGDTVTSTANLRSFVGTIEVVSTYTTCPPN